MIWNVDNNVIGLLSLALDAATMRQQAIAHNIANAAMPGFQRIGVSFEERFAALGGAAPQMSSVEAQRFQPSFALQGLPGDTVALDQEMAAMSENTLHHQALLKVLSKQMNLMSIAINEGKR